MQHRNMYKDELSSFNEKDNQIMAQVEKQKLRKKRHETLKAAAIRLIKHEVQERAKIQNGIKQRMMLQQ